MSPSTRASDTDKGVRSTIPSARRSAWDRLRRRRTAAAGLVVLGMLLASSLAAPLLMGDPDAVDFAAVLQSPSPAHPLGTDQLGRDLLTRVIYGGRISFLIGALAVLLALAAGIPVGVISGYAGGTVDLLVQRGVDLLLAFPGFLLALTLIAVLGVGVTNVVVSVAAAAMPVYIRLFRGATLSIREQAYVEAARALSARDAAIIVRHVLPNSMHEAPAVRPPRIAGTRAGVQYMIRRRGVCGGVRQCWRLWRWPGGRPGRRVHRPLWMCHPGTGRLRRCSRARPRESSAGTRPMIVNSWPTRWVRCTGGLRTPAVQAG